MPAIRIDTFGGEFPSVSPRGLASNASQVNKNLYLGTPEFRPLAADTVVATCPTGTKTMHRFARDVDGEFTTDHTINWQFSPIDRSYVKGQVNDERTERTYYTTDDGSVRPQAIDVNGSSRRLGVPRPMKPSLTKVATDEFTMEDANTFLYGDVAEAIRKAIVNSTTPLTTEPQSRYSGTAIYGGPYEFYTSLSADSFAAGTVQRAAPWQSQWLMSSELSEKLDMNTIGGRSGGGGFYIPLAMLPAVYRPNYTTMATALAAIVYPGDAGAGRAGTQVLSTGAIAAIVDRVTTALDPSRFAKTQRDRLDAIAREFKTLVATSAVSLGAKPTQPVKPTTAEYIQEGGGDGGDFVRSAAWIAYDAAMVVYTDALAAYNAGLSDDAAAVSALSAKITALQNEAALLTREIEVKSGAAWNALAGDVSSTTTFLLDSGGVGEYVGDVDPDRIVDTRFYVVTFVTDWGEESEPSEPTDLIEIDQNDTITIDRPLSTSADSYATRHIEKWRIYRSNVATKGAAFQFVEELAIAVATFTDDKLGEQLGELCPTTTWAEPPYRMDAQFDGYPKPVSGSNPFLRGMVGMPNGIMAGFIDNMVAFCEPYVPYAWPVEYQITTEHPIVGLGVFDTTLFVGTTGKPYFISGSDSASMSSQQAESNQSCVSAKSVVSVQGGVLYASPDGLCLADASGVRVVTLGLYTREDWQKLSPTTMQAAEHEGIYYLFYDNGTPGCLAFDLVSRKLGRVDLVADAVFVDRMNDVMYVADGAEVRAVFSGATRRTAKWKSGQNVDTAYVAYAWVQVIGDQTANAPAVVRWYGDGVLRHTATLPDMKAKRLPPGRYKEHTVEVESSQRITQVVLASSTKELQAV